MGDTVLTVILNIHDELPETDCEVKLVCFMMRRDAHLKEDILGLSKSSAGFTTRHVFNRKHKKGQKDGWLRNTSENNLFIECRANHLYQAERENLTYIKNIQLVVTCHCEANTSMNEGVLVLCTYCAQACSPALTVCRIIWARVGISLSHQPHFFHLLFGVFEQHSCRAGVS